MQGAQESVYQRRVDSQSEGSSPREREELFVFAVDFGTSYTGYAFSSRDSFEKKPLEIYGMVAGGSQKLEKVPSSILLTPGDAFHSFGRSAELTYAEKCADGELDWKLFKNFKMYLYNTNFKVTWGFLASDSNEIQKTTRNLLIEDCRGQTVSAMTLFSLLLGYLKKTFLQQLEDSVKGVGEDCVRWVITVPAIWDDSAKQFMREAAEKAGFEKNKITLALEPECAALYFGYLIQDLRATLQEEMLQILGPGARYLLLDIGGGAVDITAHEVNGEFQYDELFAVTGGPWGGENVNLAFQDYLRQIFTNETFSEFCRNHMEDFYELMDDFERKKKTFDYTRMRDVVIKLPYFLLKQIDSSSVAQDLAVIDHDKLKIPYYRMLKFFDDTIDKISQHIKDKLQEGALENITSVILVGGFSVSGIVKERLKNLFPNDIYMYFHCPENAELATLTGAVIYGQIQLRKKCILQEANDPCLPAIHSRRSRYTYGIDSHVAFNPEKHPESKKFRDGKDAFCKDFFWVFLRAGTKLTQSKKGIMRTFTADKDSKTLDVVIYRTENADPKFVDDPACFKLGKLIVDMREGVGTRNREVKIGLQYNDTELSVYAINNRDEIIKTTFDMLDAV